MAKAKQISVGEAGRLLSLKDTRVKELVRDGKVRGAKSLTKGHWGWRINAASVKAYLTSSGGVLATEGDETLNAQVLAKIKKHKRKPPTILGLADEFDRSPKNINEAVRNLIDGGHMLDVLDQGELVINKQLAAGTHKEPLIIHPRSDWHSDWHKVGAISDNHAGSKWERPDVVNAVFDLYEDEGITDVFHGGNMLEGESHFNKFDINISGLTNQVEHFIDTWPQRAGITTHFVTGDDHEGWYQQREGIRIGEFIQMAAEKAGRFDLKFLGHVEADIDLPAPNGDPEGTRHLRVLHGGGGSSHAISYTTQVMINSFQGGEKPDIMFVGHYHKFDHNYWREVHNVQLGCTTDQSIFMRKKKLQAHVGASIVAWNQAEDGAINRFRVEFLPFYDRGYYTKKGMWTSEG